MCGRVLTASPMFVRCIRNDGYLASLNVGQQYFCIPDDFAEARGLIRVIDDSAESYLYPQDFFEKVAPDFPGT